MNLHEMRVKYAFWKCQEYSETKMLFSKLTHEEKSDLILRLPDILKGLSTINDVENLVDISFEGRMCLKYAIRKAGVL